MFKIIIKDDKFHNNNILKIKKIIIIFNMDFFSYTKKKIEEKIKDYFWGSFGMAS
jgi:hypothetical protein